MKRMLVLEDGTVYQGQAFGADQLTMGEVVFTTGMTGYQEAITDQSFANQILVFTNPLLGNYGINPADHEALNPQIKGVICNEVARHPSNWRATQTLPDYLTQQGIPGLAEIDTRALVKKLRYHGTLRGALVDSTADVAAVVKQLKRQQPTAGVIKQVATPVSYPLPGGQRKIVVMDFGLKHSILRALIQRNCNVVVVPYTASLQAILQLQPDGVLLSNGPGDPAEMMAAAAVVRQLEQQVPVFGICMGHQVFALANGASTFKLKFGHRGFNHPVKNLVTGAINFSSQNHGYAVDPASIPATELTVTEVELNDGTIEGLAHQQYPAFSVQFHPDAAPGPHDLATYFDQFIAIVDAQKQKGASDAKAG